MKRSKFMEIMNRVIVDNDDPEVEFVGIKWQEEHHPSAEIFPIEFVDAKSQNDRKITLKFITTKHNQ